jgi:hypothetical protein
MRRAALDVAQHTAHRCPAEAPLDSDSTSPSFVFASRLASPRAAPPRRRLADRTSRHALPVTRRRLLRRDATAGEPAALRDDGCIELDVDGCIELRDDGCMDLDVDGCIELRDDGCMDLGGDRIPSPIDDSPTRMLASVAALDIWSLGRNAPPPLPRARMHAGSITGRAVRARTSADAR